MSSPFLWLSPVLTRLFFGMSLAKRGLGFFELFSNLQFCNSLVVSGPTPVPSPPYHLKKNLLWL